MTRMLLAIFFASTVSYAATSPTIIDVPFNSVPPEDIGAMIDKSPIKARHYRLLEINLSTLYQKFKNVPRANALKKGSPVVFYIPLPDGSEKGFRIVENTTLDPDLSKKFPRIKTYDGYSLDKSHQLAKFDITPQGFHAMILASGQSPVFIDPLDSSNPEYYLVYSKKDLKNSKPIKCGVTGNAIATTFSTKPFKHFINYNSCELKTYRLAMAATAQYTDFHGGTVEGALSAQATTMNRVNGIYETDMAITMQIIANNDLLIYTDPNNQPYTSGIPRILIVENQANVDAVIGTNFYDIGHVVDAAGSGLAALSSVCDPSVKAEGVTGTDSPIGDPFDVDFVAHEMGHQFGANHTQNNDCNRHDQTAVEPGSGSTIMGYAGICAPNVQRNSDGYFHGISLGEMGDFVSSPTHTCPVRTPITGAPVVNPINPITIPVSTPFFLTAEASGSTNSALSFTWEQVNNEISQQPPVSYAVGGPNFRSLPPKLSPTRYFPDLKALANNGPFTWEVIPSVSRFMDFRVTVRNNTAGGSCNAYNQASLTVAPNAGPFIVTYPGNGATNVLAGAQQQITWNVANTNLAPVNALNVDILLSTDGGLTYPYVLAQNIENSGSAIITVPTVSTVAARIMVKATTGNFFNISPGNFFIGGTNAGFSLTKAVRNPLRKTSVFVYFTGSTNPAITAYSVGGIIAGSVTVDVRNQRFIINDVTSPKASEIYIVATEAGQIQLSNPITIPGIL